MTTQNVEPVKLEGNATLRAQGTHVDAQGFATKDGFSRVSQHWLPQTQTWEEGLARIETVRSQRKDGKADIRSLSFGDNGKALTVNVDGNPLVPTMWAILQLCNWLHTPQTVAKRYASGDSRDRDCLRYCLERGLEMYGKAKDMIFRTYDDGTLRAVMSEVYSIVDNRWYLEVLKGFIPGGRLDHFSYSDADNIYGSILIPDTIRVESDSEYGGLLDIGNSEIGYRVLFQTPSIFRAICMNGCRWGVAKGVEIRKRHRGIELSDLKEAIRLNIDKQIPLLTTKIDTLRETQAYTVALSVMSPMFAAIANEYGLRGEIITKTADEWCNHSQAPSLFGVIDGLTRAAQTFSADTWEKCNQTAGVLMLGGRDNWEALASRAKVMTGPEVSKAFGNVAV